MTASVSSAGSDRRIGGFRLFAKRAYHIVLLGLGRHAVAAGDLADFDAMLARAVLGDEFFERGTDARLDLGVFECARVRRGWMSFTSGTIWSSEMGVSAA